MTLLRTTSTALLALATALPALAQEELNLYSSRHYDTDERLYSDFTEQTGITINRIEGKADELLAELNVRVKLSREFHEVSEDLLNYRARVDVREVLALK